MPFFYHIKHIIHEPSLCLHFPRFILEATDPAVPDLNQIFTITPQKGSLNPNDRPTCVQFVFRHNKEVSIREQPILRCQVSRLNQ